MEPEHASAATSDDQLMTVGEVATFLHLSVYTVRRLLASRILPGVAIATGTVRRTWRVQRRDVKAFVQPPKIDRPSTIATTRRSAYKPQWV
jgi:excisionase family DNA binding protein